MVADQAIFLDVGHDRYFSVGGAAAQAMQALLEQRPASKVELDRLLKAGLIEIGEAPQPSQLICATVPARSLVEEGGGRAFRGLGPLLQVSASLAKARRDVKRRPLASILDDIKSRKAGGSYPSVRSSDARLEVAATFNAARRFVPIKPSCLQDSLALLACLARRRLSADLVFGVKLHPFSAHCWVQAGDIVLNDAIDHVTIHTPILVI